MLSSAHPCVPYWSLLQVYRCTVTFSGAVVRFSFLSMVEDPSPGDQGVVAMDAESCPACTALWWMVHPQGLEEALR
jgi:hypothetical protein